MAVGLAKTLYTLVGDPGANGEIKNKSGVCSLESAGEKHDTKQSEEYQCVKISRSKGVKC